MRVQEIERYLKHRPFKPFRLCMTDGSSYEVRHPEMLLVSRTAIAMAVHERDPQRPEGIVCCDPLHITRVEPVPQN